MKTKLSLYFATFFTLAVTSALPALATKVPVELKQAIKEKFPKAQLRIDAMIQEPDGTLYVPVLPSSSAKNVPGQKIALTFSNNDLFQFSNGWIFLKLQKTNNKLTLELPADLPEPVLRSLYNGLLPPDLLIPQNMAVSGKLKPLAKELAVEILKDGVPPVIAEEKFDMNSDEKLFLASPKSGKIYVLSKTFEKLSEVATDGTPACLVWFKDKLYVADQSKSLVIVYDPKTMKWDTFIEFPPQASVRSLAISPKGDRIYVCEAATSTIATVDLSSKKVIQRTKVLNSPGDIAITPDGYTLVVSSGTGHVSFISTLTNKVVGVVSVGKMPSNVILSKKHKLAFVANRVSNTVSVIDVTQRKLITNLSVGEGPTGLAFDASEDRLYVANAKDNNISIYSITQASSNKFDKIETVSLPLDVEFPGCLVLTADQNHLLVTSAASDTVGFLNLETLKFDKQVQVGQSTMEAVCSLKAPD
ncbi:MAG: YncE family protein [Cyanobacteria bacterium TGS_CYA1]|nr:YncE family protein [Cyanobacteria bacterium TGS_CYA1]